MEWKVWVGKIGVELVREMWVEKMEWNVWVG
jgi:hypothetical protein